MTDLYHRILKKRNNKVLRAEGLEHAARICDAYAEIAEEELAYRAATELAIAIRVARDKAKR